MGALSLRLYHHARAATPRATCARFPPSMATGFPIPGGAIAARAFRPRFLLHPLGAERIIRHSLNRVKNGGAHDETVDVDCGGGSDDSIIPAASRRGAELGRGRHR